MCMNCWLIAEHLLNCVQFCLGAQCVNMSNPNVSSDSDDNHEVFFSQVYSQDVSTHMDLLNASMCHLDKDNSFEKCSESEESSEKVAKSLESVMEKCDSAIAVHLDDDKLPDLIADTTPG